jgi:hypothetical protein
LSLLQKIIKDADNRAPADQEAFENFNDNHPVSLFSHKEYIYIMAGVTFAQYGAKVS